MSLRLRLFLLLAGLVLVLVVCQALLVRSLAQRLDRDVRAVAVSVGEELLSGFRFEVRQDGNGLLHETQLVVVETSAEGEGESARREPDSIDAPPASTPRWKMRRELRASAAQGASDGAVVTHQLVEAETIGVRPPHRLELEPGEEGGVLFLRGPMRERRIRFPAEEVVVTVDRFGRQLLLGSLALLVFGFVAAAIVAHRTTRPLAALADASQRLGSGELGLALPISRHDEIGDLVGAFNAMSARLAVLDRENRRLAESEHLSELGEVARGLAHTLRNPLNALGLAVERLAGPLAPGEAEELAERCRLQIRRLDGALRGFLALASASAARAQPVELGGLAREIALEALQDAAGRVRIDVEAPHRTELVAVEAELKAVLQALVVNACEASPAGGRVVVRVAADGDGARLEIDDEGPGIAPEVAARLFAPHVTTKPHGSGMGLYLARRLAESRYGGGVEVGARAEGGTRATLTLAARREEAR